MTIHSTLNTRVRYYHKVTPLKRKPDGSFKAMLERGLREAITTKTE